MEKRYEKNQASWKTGKFLLSFPAWTNSCLGRCRFEVAATGRNFFVASETRPALQCQSNTLWSAARATCGFCAMILAEQKPVVFAAAQRRMLDLRMHWFLKCGSCTTKCLCGYSKSYPLQAEIVHPRNLIEITAFIWQATPWLFEPERFEWTEVR